MKKINWLIIDLCILMGIIYSLAKNDIALAGITACIFSLKNLQITRLLHFHKKEITPLLDQKLFIVTPDAKTNLDKVSVIDRGALLDKLEEIQEDNYAHFMGVNESMLHTREDIADLLIKLLKQHYGIRKDEQVSTRKTN